MKENQEYVRKRRPITFTLSDLDEDDEDKFEMNIQPSTSRSLPTRNCKPNKFNKSDDDQNDTEEDESELDDSNTEEEKMYFCFIQTHVNFASSCMSWHELA